MTSPYNVLILCTGNSARSLIAETLIRDLGAPTGLIAYSAGSKPKGQPHPMALKVLSEMGHEVSDLRSKSWDEFGGEDAPGMDLVITVCGNARDEVCPIWPGHPLQIHWGLQDPAAVEGDGQKMAFETTYRDMKARVEKLVALDLHGTETDQLRSTLQKIHATSPGVVE